MSNKSGTAEQVINLPKGGGELIGDADNRLWNQLYCKSIRYLDYEDANGEEPFQATRNDHFRPFGRRTGKQRRKIGLVDR